MSNDGSLRADAQRNRARVLDVAAQVFAAEGLSVPVHEIARRAGVGTGTVSRHFPTKEDLFEAILRDRMTALVAHADRLVEQEEPKTAFILFFTAAVRAGAADRGFAERLAAAAGDRNTLNERVEAQLLCDRLGDLLSTAQQTGAVRSDVTLDDVEALMVACMTREEPLEPIIAVVTDGLCTHTGSSSLSKTDERDQRQDHGRRSPTTPGERPR